MRVLISRIQLALSLFLNVVLSAYIEFMSGIPEAVEISKIGCSRGGSFSYWIPVRRIQPHGNISFFHTLYMPWIASSFAILIKKKFN